MEIAFRENSKYTYAYDYCPQANFYSISHFYSKMATNEKQRVPYSFFFYDSFNDIIKMNIENNLMRKIHKLMKIDKNIYCIIYNIV